MIFFKTNDQYNTGFTLNEYKGTFSLIAARESNDKVYERWGDIEIGKDKKKRLPVSVELGEVKAAISVLRAVIDKLEGNPQQGTPEPPADDVPF